MGPLLTSSLDRAQVIGAAAELLVRDFADVCIVDLVDETESGPRMLLNLGQTWLLAVLTLLLALPLGLLLAWCLDAVINVQAFGWRLPLQVFPWQLAQLLGLALLATLLASAWPLWQLYRSRPADLLRTFAHED